jgi:hypothetical protein
MKAILAIMFSLYIAGSSAQDEIEQAFTKDEVQHHLELITKAFDTADIDSIVNNQYVFEPGFGFRTRKNRGGINQLSKPALKDIIENWYASMEYYRMRNVDHQIEIHGDIAVAWGKWIEELKVKNRAPEKLIVRFTFTFKKTSSGRIISILAHRDVQKFDDGGRYIPSSP